jgi:hypothetical protein
MTWHRAGPLVELRDLPTYLSQPETAGELSLSVHTVSTHIRHLDTKLGANRRGERSGGCAPSACSHPPHVSGEPPTRPLADAA